MNASASPTTRRHPTTALAAAFACLLVLCESTFADLIVNWGGGYVSQSQALSRNTYSAGSLDLDGDLSADDAASGILFSDTQAMSPSSNYGGQTGTNASFYGGAILSRMNGTADSFDDARVRNSGPTDAVELTFSQQNHDDQLRAAFLWKQADFLNGGNAMMFDSTTSISFGADSSSTQGMSGAEIRVLVRDDQNNYWLSRTAFTSPSGGSAFTWDAANQGFGEGTDGDWAAWDPLSALSGQPAGSDLRFDQSNATWVTKDFDSINAIGFLLEQDNFQDRMDFHFRSFSVSSLNALDGSGGAAVPEPSTWAGCMLLLAAGAWRGRSRWFARKKIVAAA